MNKTDATFEEVADKAHSMLLDNGILAAHNPNAQTLMVKSLHTATAERIVVDCVTAYGVKVEVKRGGAYSVLQLLVPEGNIEQLAAF